MKKLILASVLASSVGTIALASPALAHDEYGYGYGDSYGYGRDGDRYDGGRYYDRHDERYREHEARGWHTGWYSRHHRDRYDDHRGWYRYGEDNRY